MFLNTASPNMVFALITNLAVESLTYGVGSFNKLYIIVWNEPALKY